MPVRFVVSPSEVGERLDRLIASRVPGVGRKLARELFAAGRVSMDGRRVRAATPASAGAEIVVEHAGEGALPDPTLALDLRLELPEIVVAYKPAGMPTAPLRAGELGTLANALLQRFPEMASIGHRAREPGLVHRLDNETSGLVLAARSPRAFSILSRALTQGKLSKRYLAVVSRSDLPDSGVVERPLSPDPSQRGRVLAHAEPPAGYARGAVTRFRVLERANSRALLELDAARAFRHQVRAHLAAIGAPLVGDALYGGEPWPGPVRRHALHASYIAWAGDATLPSFRVSAELPEDLADLLGR